MLDRPKCFCRDCGYQWFSHGPQHSPRCPGCRGPNVAPVMSLDDASSPEPEPTPKPAATAARPSRLPKILMLVAAGLALHAIAGTIGVLMFRKDKPHEPEVAVAPAPAPTPAPKVTPRNPAPVTPKVNVKP